MWKYSFEVALLLNTVIWQQFPTLLAQEGCSLNMNGDLPSKNQPLMLKKIGRSYSLIIPKVKGRQGLLELQKGEELILACPGQGNQLSKTRRSSSVGSCLHDNQLTIGDVAIKSVDAHCTGPTIADVIPLKKKCANSEGDLYEIGFQAEGWHPMITVCFNLQRSFTYYAQHTLIGAALKGAEDEPDRPVFSDGARSELYSSNPNDFYKKTNQKKYFENQFGKDKAAVYYSDDRFLSRGHLAPDGDFLFGSWQFATYFYINAAPQWQPVNAGNWLSVEKKVRNMASRVKKDFMVVTATYGVLSLEDSKGKAHLLYLDKQKLPIPEFFIKVVYDSKTKDGIAFITSNNPYLKSASEVKKLCKDIECAKHKWTITNANQIEKSFTYCCDVNDLRNTVTYLPNFEISGILTG